MNRDLIKAAAERAVKRGVPPTNIEALLCTMYKFVDGTGMVNPPSEEEMAHVIDALGVELAGGGLRGW